ncbi:class I SAM-dependent methyltransferase [Sterolibacterium denitrificans]|uniref:class I SAM-dependent methyltransferase n=1 Tax=Sterolibacterium denitrificans TaxID=157592 RepID=UPI0013651963|nr:class I SAM-dependent methyltransferase [Sterolibacterium denitrificans]
MARIYTPEGDKETPVIDQDRIKHFFLERADKLKRGDVSYKQAIIYQDKSGDLAEERDFVEKSLLLPKLKLTQDDRLLDVGCGTGRWAEAVADSVGHYHGADLVEELLEEAKNRIPSERARFSCLPCTDISFSNLNETLPFGKIIIFGVFMYLNDVDIPKALGGISAVADKSCTLLLREPIGVESRLTIKEHFSGDMDQFYSAIYRTEGELISVCMDVLGPAGFRLEESADVFANAAHNNRIETKQKYFLFKRN